MKVKKVAVSSLVVSTMLMGAMTPSLAYTKDETVYTKLDENGNEKITIVSEHLKNDKEEKTLKDVSTLSDIFNVNGDETLTQDGENIVWDAHGNDIYYQGKTNKTLPISMNITYKLDGKEMSVDDMLNKAGRVEINIKYKNNVKKTVNHESLYVPFVVTTGVMLPTDQNSQVEVTHGKVVSNGSQYVIVALAAPGLYENYDQNKNLKDFDEVTIEYKTKKFELKSMISAATPTVLSDEELEVFDKMNDLDSMMDELTSSYSKLQKGGEDLNKGISEFSTQYDKFDIGVSQLSGGLNTIVSGSKQLNSGLTVINNGLQELDQHSNELTSGAKQTFEVLLSTATTQLKSPLQAVGINMPDLTIANYHQTLSDVLEKIAGATTLQVTQAIKDEVSKQVRAVVDQNIEKAIEDALKEQDDQIRQGVQSTIIQNLVNNGYSKEEAEAYLNSEEGKTLFQKEYQAYVKQLKEKNINEQKQSQTYQETIANALQEQMQSQSIQDKIKAEVSKHTTGDEKNAYMQVFNLQVQLDSFSTFYKGIQEYTASVSQLKEGTKQALSGSQQLDNGLNQLQKGAEVLSTSSSQLGTAAKLLKEGSTQLTNGMIEFNEKGITKLSDVVNNVLKKNVNKTKQLVELADDYQTFTKVSDGVDSTTKFVMIVDGKTK